MAGWQVAGVTTIQSGTPVNVTLNGDNANIGISDLQRPNLVGAVPSLNCQAIAGSLELGSCYDAAAFAMPAPSRSATRRGTCCAGRNSSPPTCR